MIYFDNGATGYPKPPDVAEKVKDYLLNIGATSGRSGHKLALKAEKIVYAARENLASLFNIKDSSRVVFTSGATESLNTVIFGFLNEGDEVSVTSMEHNAVMRPLRYLEKEKNIKINILQADTKGKVDLKEITDKITDKTKLIIINHASNIIGSVISLEEVGKLKRNALLLVDAAQSGGTCHVDVVKDNIDFLAFTGHKGLMGPSGTGGLYVRKGIDLRPLKLGGTGSISEKEEQPDFYPDRMESGTLNVAGISGLRASTDFILKTGMKKIYEHKMKLSSYFMEKIFPLNEVELYGPDEPENVLPVFSIDIKDRDPSEIAFLLDREYDICVRAGLHCAPAAHKTIGSYPKGTVRISAGYFNTEEEIDFLVSSLRKIIKGRKFF